MHSGFLELHPDIVRDTAAIENFVDEPFPRAAWIVVVAAGKLAQVFHYDPEVSRASRAIHEITTIVFWFVLKFMLDRQGVLEEKGSASCGDYGSSHITLMFLGSFMNALALSIVAAVFSLCLLLPRQYRWIIRTTMLLVSVVLVACCFAAMANTSGRSGTYLAISACVGFWFNHVVVVAAIHVPLVWHARKHAFPAILCIM